MVLYHIFTNLKGQDIMYPPIKKMFLQYTNKMIVKNPTYMDTKNVQALCIPGKSFLRNRKMKGNGILPFSIIRLTKHHTITK